MTNFAHTPPAFPLYILLNDVRSHLNTGSIFRSADAFAATQMVLSGITGCPPHRDIQKTALGATETVPWTYSENAVETVLKWKEAGIRIVAIEQTNKSILLNDFVITNHAVALILGNEVDGVSPELLELCDEVLEIPQFGSKHSLNVSVAAGIALHHFAKLRFRI